MPHDVIMPALGMAQDTGRIVAWLKQPGDAVTTGDPLMEVETDKATMEIEAQADGFLTNLRAEAGDDVPVGDVVAVIADSPDGAGTSDDGPTGAALETAATPEMTGDEIEGHKVIMPTLGMSQDTGRIVAWLKEPGDEIGADDDLLEIETDKATMEIPAGQDGFLAATFADAGEDVPVGDVIAVISAEKPGKPVRRSLKVGKVPQSGAVDASDAPHSAPQSAERAPRERRAPLAPAANGRILASPKARRLAAAEGLALSRLVTEGHTPPFHVADLETLRDLPAKSSGSTPAASSAISAAARHLTARVEDDGLRTFQDWMAKTAGPPDRAAILAAFAAASLRAARTDGGALVVVTESFGRTRHYTDPDHSPLGAAAPSDECGTAQLIVRDLSHTTLSDIRLGAEDAPALTLARGSSGLQVTLECAAGHLPAAAALALITDFAGRIGDPLRHLL